MGVFFIVLTYLAFIFVILILTIKIFKMVRMPTHLRWELAPIPHVKEKKKYNSSYLEKWHQKRRKSFARVVIYMAKEMFLFQGVWKNNRSLWPFSLSMHIGIYLVILSILLHIVNALLIITGVNVSIVDISKSINAIIALAGYILGGFGAIGLILKRSMDINFRVFSSFSVYFRLVLLAAIFISGIFAWFYSSDIASELSLFTRNVLTLDSGITLSTSLTVHVIILLLFLVYLPLTDMTHFIAKYFTYHTVRWNDESLNPKMDAELSQLKGQTSTWSAPHIASGKTWAEMTVEKSKHEKAS